MERGLISQRDQILSEPQLSREFKSLVSDIMLTNRNDPTRVRDAERARELMQNSVD